MMRVRPDRPWLSMGSGNPSRKSPIVLRTAGVGASRRVRRASTKGSQICVYKFGC
jgi:hypothetical protein